MDKFAENAYTCLIEWLECFCATDKIGEKRAIKYELVKEFYSNVVEQRGVDPGHDVFQVLAVAFEVEGGESGEDSPYCRRWALAYLVHCGHQQNQTLLPSARQ